MKTKKVDFLIRYEHKVRDLESIMLIRAELERRGYSVAFICNYEYNPQVRYQPKVLVSPAIYSDANLIGDFQNYGLLQKIVNLLWEQLIGIKDEESPNCSHNVVGTGQKAITLCWGEQTQNRIVASGVPSKNAIVVGQLNLDLLKEPFNKTLLSKEELAERYNLDGSKKWLLFVSSFAYSELDPIQIAGYIKDFGEEDLNYMINLSNKSRSEILKWFEIALQKYPESIIIYRPHPDEARKSQVLKDMEAKYPNFRVISELALKHWMNASDKVYNWYSTGLVDAKVLNKPIRLLRPCHIDRDFDYRIYLDAKKITTKNEFLADFVNFEKQNILDEDLFNSYYYIPKHFTYMKVCDILEDMLKTNKYDINYSLNEYIKFGSVIVKAKFIKCLKPFLPIMQMLPVLKGMVKKRLDKRDIVINTLKQGYDKNVATEQDIQEIYQRVKPIIYGPKV